MKQRTREQVAMRVFLITIVQNIVLSCFKLAAGFLAHSGAMLSDAASFGIRCDDYLYRNGRRKAWE